MQMEKLIEKKDEEYKLLLSKIAPLQKFVEDFTESYKKLQALYEEALKVIREKDKQIQRPELIEHQCQQLQRLVYAKSSEKSSCNAHARRKFHEARFTAKKGLDMPLILYSKLYGVESYCKEMNLSFDQRKEIRQEKSVPVSVN
jgi:hypothetical protein